MCESNVWPIRGWGSGIWWWLYWTLSLVVNTTQYIVYMLPIPVWGSVKIKKDWPKFILDPDFFWPKPILDPDLLRSKFLLEQNFFWTNIFSGTLFFWTNIFFSATTFLAKIFVWPNFSWPLLPTYWTQNFWSQFLLTYFLGHIYFWPTVLTQIFYQHL